jgi:small GTP-binding protein
VIQRKLCLLGAFAVGKTSLVARFARTIYSPRYLTTVGVEIHRTEVRVRDSEATLLLWDLAGQDDLNAVKGWHVRGASACLYVADVTRPATLEVALDLKRRVDVEHGHLPSLLALNKVDLAGRWALPAGVEASLEARGIPVLHTSARTGRAVEQAFLGLAAQTLAVPA